MKPFLLYSDFNCPFCYALHERLHELQLFDRCEWRGVQHAPHLPRPMKEWQGTLAAELRHEVTVVQRLAPGLPITLPAGKPNTGPAIEQAAYLLSRNLSQGLDFVRRIYRAFWCGGQDIADSVVLSQLAMGCEADDGGGDSRRIVQEWARGWHETGQAGVPLIVSPQGDVLVGCVPPEDVRRFFS